MKNDADLSEDELLHLAIQASRDKNHADAIVLLKRAIARSKDNYKAVFLLAAEHAQIGMVDLAISGYRAALILKPDLVPARFQLGLILLTVGRLPEAFETWSDLERLDKADPYLHFKRGLELLARNDMRGCEENLLRGMELNSANVALNSDMRQVLDAAKAIEARLGSASGKPSGAEMYKSAYATGPKTSQ